MAEATWVGQFYWPEVGQFRWPLTEAVQALRDLQGQHSQLQAELRRKDKALAEAAALLVLQKKFRALLEDEGK